MNFLVCTKCNNKYPLDLKLWQCQCGSPLDIEFESEFPIEKIIKRKPTMWRYREAIPVSTDENIMTFSEGFTPLIEVDFNERPVLIKQDHLFQTGSYKDRGASVLVSKMKELGITQVVEDSSGNAGCAIAAYCTAAGISCEIYVLGGTSINKLIQLEYYGAKVQKIPGSREDTASAVQKAAEEIYYASHCWNPFFFHGTKTFAFEVCEQLGWSAPGVIILPVGNGTLLLGAYIGFTELMDAGIITKLPKIIGVQSANCSPLVEAFASKFEKIPDELGVEFQNTIAEGIAIEKPVRGDQILKAVRNSGGMLLSVTEDEIKDALVSMGKKGFYIEPTAAATIAGVRKYLDSDSGSNCIVSSFTGHGLKNTEKMLKVLNE